MQTHDVTSDFYDPPKELYWINSNNDDKTLIRGPFVMNDQ